MYPTPEHELQIHPKQVLCRRHLNVVVNVDANANKGRSRALRDIAERRIGPIPRLTQRQKLEAQTAEQAEGSRPPNASIPDTDPVGVDVAMLHDARVPDAPPLLHRHGRIHHDVAPVAVVMEPGDERTRPARQSHRLAETAMPPSLPGGVSPRRRVSPPGGGRSVGGGARRDEVDELGRRAEVHERPGGDGANAKLVPRQGPVDADGFCRTPRTSDIRQPPRRSSSSPAACGSSTKTP